MTDEPKGDPAEKMCKLLGNSTPIYPRTLACRPPERASGRCERQRRVFETIVVILRSVQNDIEKVSK